MTEFEIRAQLEAEQREFKSVMDSFPMKKLADGKEARDIPGDKIEELRKRNEAINDLGKQLEEQMSFRSSYEKDFSEKPANIPDQRGGKVPEVRSIYEQITSQERYVDALYREGGISVDAREFRTLVKTTAGFAPQVLRENFVIPAISKPLGLLDFVAIVPTTQNSTKFMKQTTRTNNAGAKAEGTQTSNNESAFVWTEITSPITKITHFVPVTREQLEDEPGFQSILEMDLMLGARQKLDDLITVGSGSGADLTGVYSASGALSQARSTDPYFDCIMKGMTKVRTANSAGGRGGRFANPNLVLLHPTDYQTVVLERTADGVYIWGNPGEAPMSRIWGVNVGQSLALTQGTGVVLDTTFMRVRMRDDARIFATDSHASYFVEGIETLRCDLRAGFEIHSDEAICKLTGL